jgi:hypothetical protein
MGGSERRVFGAAGPAKNLEEINVSDKKSKDLTPKSSKPVRGGGMRLPNDNLTLVRAATPAKKDLAASNDVKGGKKRK